MNTTSESYQLGQANRREKKVLKKVYYIII